MLEIRVLGDLVVLVDGVVVPVPQGLVRNALLALVVSLDRVVPDQVLSERLWGDEAPRTAAYSLRNVVSRLRDVVGEAAVVRASGGYRLLADAAQVDIVELERHLSRGRAQTMTDPGAALVELDAALALVRGESYRDVRDDEWAVGVARSADELVAAVEEAWTDARLRIGNVGADLWRIRAFVAAAPMRERRWCQLVDALSLDARRAEALRAVQEAKSTLAEYGLVHGPELTAAERRALQTDSSSRRDGEVDESEARVRASHSLLRAGAFDEARALLEQAAALAAEHGGRRSAARVKLEQARLAMLSGEGDPRALLDEARAVGRELRDGSLLADAALVGFAAGISPAKGDALVELLEPLPLLPTGSSEAIDLLCAASVTVAFADASPAARRLLVEATSVHTRHASVRSEALLAVTRTMVDSVEGAPRAEVAESAERALALAESADDHLLVVMASMAALRAAYQRGDFAAVDRMMPTLEHSSRMAMLPFGTMRVALCRTTNAIARGDLDTAADSVGAELELGMRLRTQVTDAAVRSHRLLLAREADRMADLAAAIRAARDARPRPNAWDAVLAAAGDVESAEQLAMGAADVVPDDSYDVFLALSAEVAARRGDAALGRWCAAQLASAGDRTMMSGIGTVMLGFATHFHGLALAAAGDLRAARVHLMRAADSAGAAEAWLWWAHSQVELADVLGALGDREGAAAALAAAGRSSVMNASPRLARRVAEVTARHSLRATAAAGGRSRRMPTPR